MRIGCTSFAVATRVPIQAHHPCPSCGNPPFSYHPLQSGWLEESGTSFARLRGGGRAPTPDLALGHRVTGWFLCPDFASTACPEFRCRQPSGRGLCPRPNFAYTPVLRGGGGCGGTCHDSFPPECGRRHLLRGAGSKWSSPGVDRQT